MRSRCVSLDTARTARALRQPDAAADAHRSLEADHTSAAGARPLSEGPFCIRDVTQYCASGKQPRHRLPLEAYQRMPRCDVAHVGLQQLRIQFYTDIAWVWFFLLNHWHILKLRLQFYIVVISQNAFN